MCIRDSQQGLLQHILRLARLGPAGAFQHPAQIAAQPHADRIEEEAIGGGIAGEGREEVRTEQGFELLQQHVLRFFQEDSQLNSVAWRAQAHKPAMAR